jgi:hypothetical protein
MQRATRLRSVAGVVAVLSAAAPFALGLAAPRTQTAHHRWHPRPGVSFQWQLSGRVDTSVRAKVYDVDGFETKATTVAALHRKHRHVICYISVGSWEDWRPDAGSFPKKVIGKPLDGWPGEFWLDIRRIDVLGPILKHRFDKCRAKGFDAVEPDNVDGYANDTGFALTARSQRRFNRWLAKSVHARGMSVALKNDLEQIPRLVRSFDFALDEECLVYRECGRLAPFVRAGKAVFHVEYTGEWPRSKSCQVKGFTSIRKRLALDAWRHRC